MLENLDAIDWARLGYAYGEAPDVPSQIRALASPDEQTRDEALGDLYDNIWHQGTVYEASPWQRRRFQSSRSRAPFRASSGF